MNCCAARSYFIRYGIYAGPGLLRRAIPPWKAAMRPWCRFKTGRFIPIPFGDILDPATGRTRVRMVDVESESYVIARRYMIRLSSDDLHQPDDLVRLATTAGLASDDFRKRFE